MDEEEQTYRSPRSNTQQPRSPNHTQRPKHPNMIPPPLHTPNRQPKHNPKTNNRNKINPIPTLPKVRHVPVCFIMKVVDTQAEREFELVLRVVIRTHGAGKEGRCVGVPDCMVDIARGVFHALYKMRVVIMIIIIVCRHLEVAVAIRSVLRMG